MPVRFKTGDLVVAVNRGGWGKHLYNTVKGDIGRIIETRLSESGGRGSGYVVDFPSYRIPIVCSKEGIARVKNGLEKAIKYAQEA